MKVCGNCHNHFDSSDWHCPKCGIEPTQNDGIFILSPELGLEEHELAFPQEAFEKLYDNEASHFWFRSRNRLITWAINKYYPSAVKMLEVGCGTGYVLKGLSDAFPEMILSGNDISAKGLSFAAKRISSAAFIQFDVIDIPYFEEFDLIGTFDVIEHIEGDRKALQEIFNALKPGGGVIVSVPQHAFLWSSADEQACHKRRYSKRDLKNKLEEAGFDIIRMTSFIALLFPAMLISRVLKRISKGDADPLSELKPNKLLNTIFEAVCSIELILIKTGINFPFGGSLVAVCRKTT